MVRAINDPEQFRLIQAHKFFLCEMCLFQNRDECPPRYRISLGNNYEKFLPGIVHLIERRMTPLALPGCNYKSGFYEFPLYDIR